MDKKTTQRTLGTYRDICQVSKQQIVADMLAAVTEGAFAFQSDLDRERFFALLDTMLDQTNAKGYEIFQTQMR